MQVLRGLATAQARHGHQVVVCTTDRDHPPDGVLPQEYFRTLYHPEVTLKVFGVNFVPLLVSVSMARWLRSSICDFDIVHVHGLYRFPSSFAAWIARRRDIPYIICPHGSLDPYMHERSAYSVGLKRIYERLIDLPNLRAASALHFTTEQEHSRSAFLGLATNTIVVPNGLHWATYKQLPPRGVLRDQWKIGHGPLVLFMGRLHPVKGFDLLIPAFDAVRNNIPGAQLVIAGPENDNFGEQIRTWVRDRGLQNSVHFVGMLNDVEVVQAYVDADVVVLPSYTENFGMTIAEAMACGVPVAITTGVKIHDAVSRAKAGIVTDCDSMQLAHALETLLNDGQLRRKMGDAGRDFVKQNYTWPVVVNALDTAYESMVR
jgi:glycosyltransferase involved in cell wall biosynthesis